jgi:hypothetical protein
MEKKQKQPKPLPKREVLSPTKLLVSIPATLTSHMQHREKVVDAIKAALGEVPYTFDLPDPNSLGWDFVVEAYNKVADRVVAEDFDYVLIVESDVVIPENAFSHLLEQNVDVAVAVVPFHSYPKNPALNEMYKEIVCAGVFLDPNDVRPVTNGKLEEYRNKVVTFKDGRLVAGTGCILIKRCVFEQGIRFINNFSVASFDVYFWRDIRKARFSAAIDGHVVCEHLGV